MSGSDAGAADAVVGGAEVAPAPPPPPPARNDAAVPENVVPAQVDGEPDEIDKTFATFAGVLAVFGLVFGLVVSAALIAAYDGTSCTMKWITNGGSISEVEATNLGCSELSRLLLLSRKPEDTTPERDRELILSACDSDSPDTVRGVTQTRSRMALVTKDPVTGNTVLHECARKKCPPCCVVLLQLGADPEITNADGKIAAELASTISMYNAITRYSSAVTPLPFAPTGQLCKNGIYCYIRCAKKYHGLNLRKAMSCYQYWMSYSTYPTIPGDAIFLLNQGGWSPEQRATLQQIKHSNDRTLNTSWGPNIYWGPEDHSAEAFRAMAEILSKKP